MTERAATQGRPYAENYMVDAVKSFFWHGPLCACIKGPVLPAFLFFPVGPVVSFFVLFV